MIYYLRRCRACTGLIDLRVQDSVTEDGSDYHDYCYKAKLLQAAWKAQQAEVAIHEERSSNDEVLSGIV